MLVTSKLTSRLLLSAVLFVNMGMVQAEMEGHSGHKMKSEESKPNSDMDGMDHSRMGSNIDGMETDSPETRDSKSLLALNNGTDPWTDEEFNETLAHELNTDIGIVIHHQHKSNNWMISYKHMDMDMEGLISSANGMMDNLPKTTQEVARSRMPPTATPVLGFDYLMAPVKMSMEMQMIMAMYGWSESTSIMIMTNYIKNDMEMVMHMGNSAMIARSNFQTMTTEGLGDTKVTAMVKASDAWTISLGISIPTGSINETVVMGGQEIQAPYSMQLGTGTMDFIQTVTYKGGDNRFNWGAQGSYTYRPSLNENGYSLGEKFEISGWLRKTFSNSISVSSRLNSFDENSIDGEDFKINNPARATTFDVINTGRHQIDLSLGISKKFVSGNRIGFEYTTPMVQKVAGIQLETQAYYTLSWSYMMM